MRLRCAFFKIPWAPWKVTVRVADWLGAPLSIVETEVPTDTVLPRLQTQNVGSISVDVVQDGADRTPVRLPDGTHVVAPNYALVGP